MKRRMLVVVIVVALIASVCAIGGAAMQSTRLIEVCACRGGSVVGGTGIVKGIKGAVLFQVHNRWGMEEIYFMDIGFDGTLDQVSWFGGVDKQIVLPTWPQWVKRYEQVRKEATTGVVDPNMVP